MDESQAKWKPYYPTLLTMLVLAGGWIYNYATTQAAIREHERRITAIESSYVPNSMNSEQEKALISADTENRARLDRIESKLDSVAGLPDQVRDIRGQVMQVRVLLNERTVPSKSGNQ